MLVCIPCVIKSTWAPSRDRGSRGSDWVRCMRLSIQCMCVSLSFYVRVYVSRSLCTHGNLWTVVVPWSQRGHHVSSPFIPCRARAAGYHTYCLNPPLRAVPRGNWYCPECVPAMRRSTRGSGTGKGKRQVANDTSSEEEEEGEGADAAYTDEDAADESDSSSSVISVCECVCSGLWRTFTSHNQARQQRTWMHA